MLTPVSQPHTPSSFQQESLTRETPLQEESKTLLINDNCQIPDSKDDLDYCFSPSEN